MKRDFILNYVFYQHRNLGGYSMRQIQAEKYSKNMRIIHWIVGAFIITELVCGFLMGGLAVPFKFSVYSLHKSIGVLIFLFVVIRIFNRFNSKIPELPTAINKFERIAAKIAVFILYLGMIAMPASGYLMSVYYDYKVLFFGLGFPMFVEKKS
ncbi:MAG: Cytochrome b561 [Candidatus Midichloria mitochondrii]|uniref:Cytochrome B561 n=1 Tax=Midichloria mitochondrii (strain IricVA) TaxID=696127 RepID=F7XUF1_MIDMI|nr:cytochrome b/b6 domain-containing protein [Candidatus Midichloria mitochondrii]AEI89510.1 cytochrome B561 [Candidatus Midichloria mitochondrii IricVA]MDJ1288383.1 cytochrome b/b6 domain-containing protein [Candidatus Midichloria mitochondrii]MDJ1299223.1 cytochrome b/b6 domain-containing protein [Candidatus Midichloria mitochondrii]MDJ1313349.1 cytochrome b/b6 domain-containing protein [Candidatus Midichloria mitochondrii]MDJ1583906.1 cytochrome b/b6 domain-containing protein [Candidatus Mi